MNKIKDKKLNFKMLDSHSETAIKKVVIIGGLGLMLLCFVLVLIFNTDDIADQEQVIAISISTFGILFFGSLLLLYIRSQLKDSRSSERSDMERSEEVSKKIYS